MYTAYHSRADPPQDISELPREAELGDRTGEVIDEVYVEKGSCVHVIQRIRFEDGNEEVRPTYYKNGSYVQGGSLCVNEDVFKALVGKALEVGLF